MPYGRGYKRTNGTNGTARIAAFRGAATRGVAAKMSARRMMPGYGRTAGYYGRFTGRGAELKFFDGANTDATLIPAAGVIKEDSLNHIAQGNTEQNRIGRKCVLKRIQMRGQWTLPSTTTAGSSSDRVRLIVYLDRQTNGATAAVTDILESADINSYRNLANQQRFSILHDKLEVLNALAGGGNGTADQTYIINRNVNVYKTLNIPVEFDNSVTTGAITSIRSNNVGVLALAEGALVTLKFQWRLRFSDAN